MDSSDGVSEPDVVLHETSGGGTVRQSERGVLDTRASAHDHLIDPRIPARQPYLSTHLSLFCNTTHSKFRVALFARTKCWICKSYLFGIMLTQRF